MAHRARRIWSDEKKRSICFQTSAPGVSVAKVARPYAMNANMVFRWLRDSRYAPEVETCAADVAGFLPVEIVDRPQYEGLEAAPDLTADPGMIEIDVAGGHRLRNVRAYDPEALARLIRGLSG